MNRGSGRVALVTGTSTGIGFAVAERLLDDGYAVGCVTRSADDRAKRAFETLAERGEARWLVGDLSDAQAPAKLVEDALRTFGRLDVLVNNAGATHAKAALELVVSDVDSVLAVDVRAPLLLAVKSARVMPDGGSIVNVTSVHEHIPRPGFTVYAAAKAALGMITRALALELAPRIRVNAVAPGVVATERNQEAATIGPLAPLGRAGEPHEIAAVVSFLASTEATYLTGASVIVDGGILQTSALPPAA